MVSRTITTSPALNTLANHGFINRNGKDLTRKAIESAVIAVFNFDPQDPLTRVFDRGQGQSTYACAADPIMGCTSLHHIAFHKASIDTDLGVNPRNPVYVNGQLASFSDSNYPSYSGRIVGMFSPNQQNTIQALAVTIVPEKGLEI